MPPHSYMARMLAPYVCLGEPAPDGPVHAWRPWLSWQKCIADGPSEGNLQRVLPPGFRQSLAIDLGLPGRVAVDDPHELDAELSTDAWRTLLELTGAYERLTPARQAAVLGTLLSLGFFAFILRLARFPGAEAIASDPGHASAASAIAAARTILGAAGIGTHDLREFAALADAAPPGSLARLNAELELIVQHAKHRRDLQGTAYWRGRAEEDLARIVAERGRDSLAAHLLTSRFYRSASYVPFLAGDRDAVVAELDLCEQHALAMRPHGHKEEMLARENCIPMLQSRAKEARWLGDLPLARARLQRACDLDPADSLRWVELGEVHLDLGDAREALDCYTRAAWLAPPGAALAWFMAGEAARVAGDLELACTNYQHALAADGLCVAAARQLESVAAQLPRHRPLVRLARSMQQRAALAAAA